MNPLLPCRIKLHYIDVTLFCPIVLESRGRLLSYFIDHQCGGGKKAHSNVTEKETALIQRQPERSSV